jgi:hypothetical protein
MLPAAVSEALLAGFDHPAAVAVVEMRSELMVDDVCPVQLDALVAGRPTELGAVDGLLELRGDALHGRCFSKASPPAVPAGHRRRHGHRCLKS